MLNFLFVKILTIALLIIVSFGNAHAASKWGKGELQLSDFVVEKFIEYIRGNASKTPYKFAVSISGNGYNYYYCSSGSACQGGDGQILQECSRYSNDEKCFLFARGRTIKWKNGINLGKGKASKVSGKWSDAEIRERLTELGFLGSKTTSSSSVNTTPKKIEKKKETKKIVKKYELKGERSIALSWDGYDDLIAGTVDFDEIDYNGTLNIPLPNNDGTCTGTYSLQESGKGTWQISCTNNMGAAGTLKWSENGSVTGSGIDHNNKTVKFTVSKKS